eukprot:EG_transcript_3575
MGAVGSPQYQWQRRYSDSGPLLTHHSTYTPGLRPSSFNDAPSVPAYTPAIYQDPSRRGSSPMATYTYGGGQPYQPPEATRVASWAAPTHQWLPRTAPTTPAWTAQQVVEPTAARHAYPQQSPSPMRLPTASSPAAVRPPSDPPRVRLALPSPTPTPPRRTPNSYRIEPTLSLEAQAMAVRAARSASPGSLYTPTLFAGRAGADLLRGPAATPGFRVDGALPAPPSPSPAPTPARMVDVAVVGRRHSDESTHSAQRATPAAAVRVLPRAEPPAAATAAGSDASATDTPSAKTAGAAERRAAGIHHVSFYNPLDFICDGEEYRQAKRAVPPLHAETQRPWSTESASSSASPEPLPSDPQPPIADQVRVVEVVVEKIVEVPIPRLVERIVFVPDIQIIEVPVERVVERVVEVPVHHVREVPVEKVVEKVVFVDRIVHVPTEVTKEVVVEKLVEVPVDRIVERVVEVTVERPVYVDKPVFIEKVVYIQKPEDKSEAEPTGDAASRECSLEDPVTEEEKEEEKEPPAEKVEPEAAAAEANARHESEGREEAEKGDEGEEQTLIFLSPPASLVDPIDLDDRIRPGPWPCSVPQCTAQVRPGFRLCEAHILTAPDEEYPYLRLTRNSSISPFIPRDVARRGSPLRPARSPLRRLPGLRRASADMGPNGHAAPPKGAGSEAGILGVLQEPEGPLRVPVAPLHVTLLGSGAQLPAAQRVAEAEWNHCSLAGTAAGVVLRDLSQSGTFVNGERIGYRKSRTLKPGDVVQVASRVFVLQPP